MVLALDVVGAAKLLLLQRRRRRRRRRPLLFLDPRRSHSKPLIVPKAGKWERKVGGGEKKGDFADLPPPLA